MFVRCSNVAFVEWCGYGFCLFSSAGGCRCFEVLLNGGSSDKVCMGLCFQERLLDKLGSGALGELYDG